MIDDIVILRHKKKTFKREIIMGTNPLFPHPNTPSCSSTSGVRDCGDGQHEPQVSAHVVPAGGAHRQPALASLHAVRRDDACNTEKAMSFPLRYCNFFNFSITCFSLITARIGFSFINISRCRRSTPLTPPHPSSDCSPASKQSPAPAGPIPRWTSRP